MSGTEILLGLIGFFLPYLSAKVNGHPHSLAILVVTLVAAALVVVADPQPDFAKFVVANPLAFMVWVSAAFWSCTAGRDVDP